MKSFWWIVFGFISPEAININSVCHCVIDTSIFQAIHIQFFETQKECASCYKILEAFVTESVSSEPVSLVDSELCLLLPLNVGLSKLVSAVMTLLLLRRCWPLRPCSHSGSDPDGLGASSTISAVVATEGDLMVASMELERFKYFKVCSSLRKSIPGASQAATWG